MSLPTDHLPGPNAQLVIQAMGELGITEAGELQHGFDEADIGGVWDDQVVRVVRYPDTFDPRLELGTELTIAQLAAHQVKPFAGSEGVMVYCDDANYQIYSHPRIDGRTDVHIDPNTAPSSYAAATEFATEFLPAVGCQQ